MSMNFQLMKTSLTLLMFLILLMASSFVKKSYTNNKMRNMQKKNIALLALKSLAIISSMKLIMFSTFNDNKYIKMMKWNNKFSLKFKMSIFMDQNFMFFSTMALMVTWSIMEFSIYYMKEDPLSKKFFRLLTMFLLKMLMLTSAKNLFLFFMGWEGVGFLSFLLMGWWFTRKKAKKAALQAMIYKRMGDIGMILLISIMLMTSKGWKMTNMKFMTKKTWQKMMLMSALMAAIGKSAQFSLHPWLPAAMEGPTPVSALLHSSTMVVAGVFLLMRMSTNTQPKSIFLTLCSIMGALTAIFAATSAFRQHDMKKIMAYSTTSQLGLMVLAMGLKNPKMALFHICTHAFFKAMLFLCSGSIIHSHKKEQDLRKMSKMKKTLPITSACLFLGSIALMGIPFLSGFFSKDLILESMIENPKNLLSFILATSATFLTAAYSFRMMTFCFNKNNKENTIKPMNEENPNLYLPIIRLATGTMMTGWIFSKWLILTPAMYPLIMMKKIPMLVTIMGATMASTMIMTMNTNLKIMFFTKTWFYKKISHLLIKKWTSKMALAWSTRTLDRGWKESIGGQGIFLLKNNITQKNQLMQSGYMKKYLLSIFIMSLSMLMMILSF